jgi:hypothetical protein
MARKLFLALTILAIVAVAVPVPALAGKHRSHDGPFVSVDIFAAPYGYYPYPAYYPSPYPYYVYPSPACSWQPGYWTSQPYVDAWGRYTYVQRWVPAQYVCY